MNDPGKLDVVVSASNLLRQGERRRNLISPLKLASDAPIDSIGGREIAHPVVPHPGGGCSGQTPLWAIGGEEQIPRLPTVLDECER